MGGGEPDKDTSERNAKAVREQALSRRKAAERLGIGRDTWHRSNEGREISLRSVERLADELGVDVYVLIAENQTVLAGEASE
ncbi:MAG: helix-turn-helix transcriptional regulator [Actinobacteria bacterium]|nr:helix-turn-helix transcriptional regulator [Actinomycetota bacterium]